MAFSAACELRKKEIFLLGGLGDGYSLALVKYLLTSQLPLQSLELTRSSWSMVRDPDFSVPLVAAVPGRDCATCF